MGNSLLVIDETTIELFNKGEITAIFIDEQAFVEGGKQFAVQITNAVKSSKLPVQISYDPCSRRYVVERTTEKGIENEC